MRTSPAVVTNDSPNAKTNLIVAHEPCNRNPATRRA